MFNILTLLFVFLLVLQVELGSVVIYLRLLFLETLGHLVEETSASTRDKSAHLNYVIKLYLIMIIWQVEGY